jgi:ubiquinone/menaquinone biosynthesis C-methylase UbiE
MRSGTTRSSVRGWIYDRAITGLTTGWYRAVLDRLPYGAAVLDVGIGTGTSLVRCAEQVRAKNLQFTGLDIDRDYHARCVEEIARADLGGHVTPVLESVYDHCGGPYDAAYFSASLMLLPDPVAALRHVSGLLAPGGRLYLTQTFHHRRSPLREKVKPLLRHVVSIDFGRVTYEDEFRAVVAEAGLSLAEFVTLGTTRGSSYCLAVAVPS